MDFSGIVNWYLFSGALYNQLQFQKRAVPSILVPKRFVVQAQISKGQYYKYFYVCNWSVTLWACLL